MPPKKPKAVLPTKKIHAAYYTEARTLIGNGRANGAIEHLQKARAQLDAACRDLSDLYGANDLHRAIAKLADGARGVGYAIEEGVEARAFAVAGSVTQPEPMHTACGGEPEEAARRQEIIEAFKAGMRARGMLQQEDALARYLKKVAP